MIKHGAQLKLYALAALVALLMLVGHPQLTTAAAQPMVIDYEGQLPNGLKTAAKGTINSIDDLSNGSFKVKLFTKSEQDPTELEKFILDGPIQITADSALTVLQGKLMQQTETMYQFDVKDKKNPLPAMLFSNVAKTKAGQAIDLKVAIKHVREGAASDYVAINKGANGAVGITLKNTGGVQVAYEFLNQTTQQPIDLLVFPAISDVDFTQVFGLNAVPLGFGGNLTQTSDGNFASDGTATNGFADFPLGGIIYQFFGHTLIGNYDSRSDLKPDANRNGFDVFGAYGTTDDVEITKPDFGEVVIPKALWFVDETQYKAGEAITATLTQPINALDETINHRYANWETIFTLPKELQQADIQLVNTNGEQIAAKKTVLGHHRYAMSITPETMKQLPFAGESYHFVVKGVLDKKLADATVLNYTAETNLEGHKDSITYQSAPIAHKAQVKVAYLRQDTTESVSKSQTFTFAYGKPWEVKALADAPKGYYFDKESTKGPLKGNAVDFDAKTIQLFYAPTEKKININYFDEDNNVLAATEMTGAYQESYTTSAEDLADEYSLITEKMPENSAGVIGNKDITVNYYYKKTNGYWMNLGYDTRAITRLDYRGHIRSNALNYADGQLLTFINTEKGILLYQDTVDDGAVSEHNIAFGESFSLALPSDEPIKIAVSKTGTVSVNRQFADFKMATTITKGNFKQTTDVYEKGKKIETERYQANGVTGFIFEKETQQALEDRYEVVSKQAITDTKKAGPNVTAINAPGTSYETLLVGDPANKKAENPPKEEQQEQPMTRSVKKETTEQETEDVMAENKMTFTSELKGSATLPVDESVIFDDTVVLKDRDEASHTLKYVAPDYDVTVFEGDKQLAKGKVGEDEMLEVTLTGDDSDEKDLSDEQVKNPEKPLSNKVTPDKKTSENKTTDDKKRVKENQPAVKVQIIPKEEKVTLSQKLDNGKVVAIVKGKLPNLGSTKTVSMVVIGLILMLSAIIFVIVKKVFGGRKHV